MTDKAPSLETVRLIARILGARQTAQDEVPHLIGSVHQALSVLNGAADPPVAAAPAVVAEEPEAESAVAQRPRRTRTRAVFAPAAAPAPIAIAPRLMRRAEVAATAGAPEQAAARTRTGLRGIVKWYDPKTRIGSLRLPGHDDIAVDADALDRAAVPRLFKGQEIEASVVVEADGAVRLLAVSLPGRPETEPFGTVRPVRRQQRPVVIEMKRDALRRVGARLEAEQILGGTRR
jgi:cold shock CspA family protein